MNWYMVYRIAALSVGIFGIVMMIVVHFGYKRMYNDMLKMYLEMVERYDKKCNEKNSQE